VDADDRYLNVRYGLQWTDLKDLSKPLRVGDVVILPGKLFLSGRMIKLIYSHRLFSRSRQLWFPRT
jgi:hypothetical protein